ncbi:MAG: hypothetical protein PHY90_10240 [Desulfitobacteriaceae bacterium]|nr:hypothetical protein [Desulfitobacteriaceae bacterium]
MGNEKNRNIIAACLYFDNGRNGRGLGCSTGVWTTNQTYIRRITHVNGVPIEDTKWAKYGGVIQHVAGNYQLPV